MKTCQCSCYNTSFYSGPTCAVCDVAMYGENCNECPAGLVGTPPDCFVQTASPPYTDGTYPPGVPASNAPYTDGNGNGNYTDGKGNYTDGKGSNGTNAGNSNTTTTDGVGLPPPPSNGAADSEGSDSSSGSSIPWWLILIPVVLLLASCGAAAFFLRRTRPAPGTTADYGELKENPGGNSLDSNSKMWESPDQAANHSEMGPSDPLNDPLAPEVMSL